MAEDKNDFKDGIQEENSDEIIEFDEEKEDINITQDDVTREINLDDLYDGAVNNTVVIDPITNNEVLMTSKKPSFTFIGVILAVIILLLLYYVNNKTDLIGTTKEVKSVTTKTVTTKKVTDKGSLTCNYSSKSDAETQTVAFVANYISNKLIDSNFNFVVVSNTDSTSAVMDNLTSQYETFYINNAAVPATTVSFDKNSKGFTFNILINYQKEGYENLVITEGQTVLLAKPNKDDTIEGLKNVYTDKGFTCVITYNEG